MLSLSFLEVMSITDNLIGLFGIWKSPLCLCFQLLSFFFVCLWDLGDDIVLQLCFSHLVAVYIFICISTSMLDDMTNVCFKYHIEVRKTKGERNVLTSMHHTMYSIQSFQLPDLGGWGTGICAQVILDQIKV